MNPYNSFKNQIERTKKGDKSEIFKLFLFTNIQGEPYEKNTSGPNSYESKANLFCGKFDEGSVVPKKEFVDHPPAAQTKGIWENFLLPKPLNFIAKTRKITAALILKKLPL